MENESFIYRGIRYTIDKVYEMQNSYGIKHIRVQTRESKIFELQFNQIIFKWVLTDLEVLS